MKLYGSYMVTTILLPAGSLTKNCLCNHVCNSTFPCSRCGNDYMFAALIGSILLESNIFRSSAQLLVPFCDCINVCNFFIISKHFWILLQAVFINVIDKSSCVRSNMGKNIEICNRQLLPEQEFSFMSI